MTPKPTVRPSIAFHRHGKVIHLVYGKFEFASGFHSIRSVASKRRIILLLTCLVCVSYQLNKASAKEMIKNSTAINISISNCSSVWTPNSPHTYTSNKRTIKRIFHGSESVHNIKGRWLYLH